MLEDARRKTPVYLVCWILTSANRGPWRGTWQLSTVLYTTADSYIDLAVQGPGCVAEMAASRKQAKYAIEQIPIWLRPIAVETLGPLNESATSYVHDLGRRISLVSGEDSEPQFLFQRVSVAIQRFNAVLLHHGFLSFDHPD